MSKKKQRRSTHRRTQKKKGPSLVIPIVVGVVVVAIVIGAIALLETGRSRSSARAGEDPAQGNTAQALNTSSLPYPDVPRISLEETQNKMALDQAILVDVRSKASYDKSHAEGAISIPEAEMGARVDELPDDKDIILYCT
ncbi:MAG: rhodanese-like domain-containing protein [Anaerolineae bacterium]|jgi:flagellar basal body-associated protein FliL